MHFIVFCGHGRVRVPCAVGAAPRLEGRALRAVWSLVLLCPWGKHDSSDGGTAKTVAWANLQDSRQVRFRTCQVVSPAAALGVGEDRRRAAARATTSGHAVLMELSCRCCTVSHASAAAGLARNTKWRSHRAQCARPARRSPVHHSEEHQPATFIRCFNDSVFKPGVQSGFPCSALCAVTRQQPSHDTSRSRACVQDLTCSGCPVRWGHASSATQDLCATQSTAIRINQTP